MGIELNRIDRGNSYFNYEFVCSGLSNEFQGIFFPEYHVSIWNVFLSHIDLSSCGHQLHSVVENLRSIVARDKEMSKKVTKIMQSRYINCDSLIINDCRIGSEDDKSKLGVSDYTGDLIVFSYEYRRKLFIPDKLKLVSIIDYAPSGKPVFYWFDKELRKQYSKHDYKCSCGTKLGEDNPYAYIFVDANNNLNYICCKCLYSYMLSNGKDHYDSLSDKNVISLFDTLVLSNLPSVLPLFISNQDVINEYMSFWQRREYVIPVIRMLALTSSALRNSNSSRIKSKRNLSKGENPTSYIVNSYFKQYLYDVSSIVNDIDLSNANLIMNEVIFNPRHKMNVLKPNIMAFLLSGRGVYDYKGDFINKLRSSIAYGGVIVKDLPVAVFSYDTDVLMMRDLQKSKQEQKAEPLSKVEQAKQEMIQKIIEHRGSAPYIINNKYLVIVAIDKNGNGYNYYLVDNLGIKYLIMDPDNVVYRDINRVKFPNQEILSFNRRTEHNLYLGPGTAIYINAKIKDYDPDKDVFIIHPTWEWKRTYYGFTLGSINVFKTVGPLEIEAIKCAIDIIADHLSTYCTVDKNKIKEMLVYVSQKPFTHYMVNVIGASSAERNKLDNPMINLDTVYQLVRTVLLMDINTYSVGGNNVLLKYMNFIDDSIKDYIIVSPDGNLSFSENAPDEIKNDKTLINNIEKEMERFILYTIDPKVTRDFVSKLSEIFRSIGQEDFYNTSLKDY